MSNLFYRTPCLPVSLSPVIGHSLACPFGTLVHWFIALCLSPACLPISPKAQYFRDVDKHACVFFPVLLVLIPKSP